MSEFYERQNRETDRSYNAFCVYRDMGPLRSLKKAAASFYDTETTPKPHQERQFKEWSRRYLWVARAKEWDAEQDRILRIETTEARKEAAKHQRQLGRFMQGKAYERLNAIKRGDEIPLTQIASIVTTATTLERLALGMSTSIVEENPEPEPQQHDPFPGYEAMSEDEKVELDALLDKLEGGDES